MQDYLRRILREHELIAEAIAVRSAAKARDAMRRHLLNARERYRRLAG